MGVTIDFRLCCRGASWQAGSRKKSGAQHRESGGRLECGDDGSLTIFSSRRRAAAGIDVCVDVQMKLERRVNIDDANQLVIAEFLDAQSD